MPCFSFISRLLIFTLMVLSSLEVRASNVLTLEDFLLDLGSESTQKDGKITLSFTPGRHGEVPHSLITLIQALESRGYVVKTKISSASEFEQLTEEHRGVVVDLTSAKRLSLFSRLRSMLGLHFRHHPIALDPLKPFKDFSEQERHLFLSTTFIHSSLMLLASGLRGHLNFAAAAFLTLYFYQTFANFSEILKFKGQGKSIIRQGDELVVVVNPAFVLLANFFEELAINASINATLSREMMADASGIVQTSALMSLSKSYVDRFASQIELQKKAARDNGQLDLADRLSKKQSLVMQLFFNGVVPLVRGLVVVSKGTAFESVCALGEPAVVGVVSCLTVIEELRRNLSVRNLPERYRGEGCARAFVSRSDAESH